MGDDVSAAKECSSVAKNTLRLTQSPLACTEPQAEEQVNRTPLRKLQGEDEVDEDETFSTPQAPGELPTASTATGLAIPGYEPLVLQTPLAGREGSKRCWTQLQLSCAVQLSKQLPPQTNRRSRCWFAQTNAFLYKSSCQEYSDPETDCLVQAQHKLAAIEAKLRDVRGELEQARPGGSEQQVCSEEGLQYTSSCTILRHRELTCRFYLQSNSRVHSLKARLLSLEEELSHRDEEVGLVIPISIEYTVCWAVLHRPSSRV